MISVARKNLLHEKGRFFISTGGVAFSVMLILILLGLYRGWDEKLTEYVTTVDADLWVVQRGAADMFHSPSIITDVNTERIRTNEDVEDVAKLYGVRVGFDLNGEEAHLMIMGYDTARGVGGPKKVIEGKSVPNDGEIIIDEVFAFKQNLNLNDKLTILDKTFRIAGISTGGNLVSFQYAFLTQEDAAELLNMPGLTNYLLLDTKDSADQDALIRSLEEDISEIMVLTKPEFGVKNRRLITDTFLPIIEVLVGIGFIVGLVVISLTIYTATIEKSREYGVIKAVGARNRHLYRIIFEQSAIAGFSGFALGGTLTFAAAAIAKRFEPSFITSFAWQDVAMVFGAAVLMILASAYIPIRRLLSIDPAIVFKS